MGQPTYTGQSGVLVDTIDGKKIIPVLLSENEDILWNQRATLVINRMPTGQIMVTNKRLLFSPSPGTSNLFNKTVSIDIDDIVYVRNSKTPIPWAVQGSSGISNIMVPGSGTAVTLAGGNIGRSIAITQKSGEEVYFNPAGKYLRVFDKKKVNKIATDLRELIESLNPENQKSRTRI